MSGISCFMSAISCFVHYLLLYPLSLASCVHSPTSCRSFSSHWNRLCPHKKSTSSPTASLGLLILQFQLSSFWLEVRWQTYFGGFLCLDWGTNGNIIGTSDLPCFLTPWECCEHTRCCSPGIKSFLLIELAHFSLKDTSLSLFVLKKYPGTQQV